MRKRWKSGFACVLLSGAVLASGTASAAGANESPADRRGRRSAKRLERRIIARPAPVATAISGSPARFCPKETIEKLVSDLLHPFEMKVVVKSEHLDRFQAWARRNARSGAGVGIPEAGKGFDYTPGRWERFGRLRLADIKGSSTITFDRAAKARLIWGLTRGGDKLEEQCERVLWKKDPKSKGLFQKWVEVTPRAFCFYGEDGREYLPGGKKIPDDRECRTDCSRFSGFGYSPILDMVSRKYILKGVLFGSACVWGRSRAGMREIDERGAGGMHGEPGFPPLDNAFLLRGSSQAKVDKVFENYKLLGKLMRFKVDPRMPERLRHGPTPTAYECAEELGKVERDVDKEIDLSGIEKTIDTLRRNACAATGAVRDACKTFREGLESARDKARGWIDTAVKAMGKACDNIVSCRVMPAVFGVCLPGYKKEGDRCKICPFGEGAARECDRVRALWEDAKKRGEDLIAQATDALRACERRAENIPVLDCASLRPQSDVPTLKNVRTLYKQGISQACDCPERGRVNFFVEDVAKTKLTRLRFHVGWISTEEEALGLRVAVAVGIKEARLSLTPVMVNERVQALYERDNDRKGAELGPLKAGGLLHVEDKCLPFLLKPRLEWLMGCLNTPAAKVDVSGWNKETFTRKKNEAMRANCWAAGAKPLDCICMQGLLLDARWGCEKEDETCPKPRVWLDGKFDPVDMADLRKVKDTCADQIRKAMLLSYEIRYGDWEAKPLVPKPGEPPPGHTMTSADLLDTTPESVIVEPCKPNRRFDDEEGFFEYMKKGEWNPKGCDGTLRAAVYRGDIAKCAPNCKGKKEEYNDIPKAIPRAMIALENLRSRGYIQVKPDNDKAGFLNLHLKIDAKGGIPVKLYARFVETGAFSLLKNIPIPNEVKKYFELDRALNKKWISPVEPPAVTGAFDIIVSPFASRHCVPQREGERFDEKKHCKKDDPMGAGADFAVGAEFASSPDEFNFKSDLARWICEKVGLSGVLKTVCREVVQATLIETVVEEALERDIPRQIQWALSASLKGLYKPDLTSFIDWGIVQATGEISKAANDLARQKLGIGILINPGTARQKVEEFIKKLPKEN